MTASNHLFNQFRVESEAFHITLKCSGIYTYRDILQTLFLSDAQSSLLQQQILLY